MTTATMTPGPGRRRRRRRLVVLAVVAGLTVWLSLAAASLWSARRHTDAGVDRLRSAQAGLGISDLLEGTGRAELAAAERDFDRANDAVRSPVVAPLRWLPFVGRQVRSVEALTGSARTVVEVGRDALDETRRALEGEQPAGAKRVALARRIGGIASGASDRLRGVDLGPGNLVAPLARARDEFATRLADLRAAVADLRNASAGLARFLDGPGTYLVLAANNAEMRVGSGAYLSVGALEVRRGRLRLDEMRSVQDFPVPTDAIDLRRVDADLADRWGFLDPQWEWRSINATARFDVSARLAARMWKAATGRQVDGVLVLDAVALRSLLAVTGPVTVEGRRIGAPEVVREVMLEQYLGRSEAEIDQAARRDRLAQIAAAVLQRFEQGGWSPTELVRRMKGAIAGRHVLAWARDAVEQSAWAAIGADGTLPADGLLLGVHNFGGNKLDQFLEVSADLRALPRAGRTEVTVRVVLRNSTPAGLPRYVAGPFAGARDAAEGRYQGPVVAQLPGAATNSWMAVDGRRVQLIAAGADGPDQRVVAAYTQLDRGQTRTVTLHFELPASQDTLLVLPSARVPPVRWSVPGDGDGTGGRPEDGARRITLRPGA